MPKKHKESKPFSRRDFLTGATVGAAGLFGLSWLKDVMEFDPDKPPFLYEFSVDNFWFTKVDPNMMVINKPLKGRHKADIVIIGGGLTGLSSAYHLAKQFPEKKIALLEGAYCGYGASGRNGGGHRPDIGGIFKYSEEAGPEMGKKAFDVTVYGDNLIKEFSEKHGIECDYNETGSLLTAFNEKHMKKIQKKKEQYERIGIKTRLIQGNELKKVFNSPRMIGALDIPLGGRVNPAKLVRGMKKLVENMGVKIWERTLVLKVHPGKTNIIETELGEIAAPTVVLATNAYSQTLGFFKSGIFPVGAYNIATAPLTKEQLKETGFDDPKGMHDMRLEFDYYVLTEDNRIVVGGSEYPYYAYDGLSSGNNKRVIKKLEDSLFATFPQLTGIPIEYKWGGNVAYTLDGAPSVGVMGENKNIYYAVGYSGHGVSFAHTAARIISDLMSGKKNDFTEFFAVNRKLPYAGTPSTRYTGFHAYKWFMQ